MYKRQDVRLAEPGEFTKRAFLNNRLDLTKAEAVADVINSCLLYTSDAADERSSVDLGGRRIIKKKKKKILVHRCTEKQNTYKSRK